MKLSMADYGREIAKTGLKIKAIKISPDRPFEWSSGFKMPIYNDNRMFLFYPNYRKLITDAFEEMVEWIPFSVIAGTSTAGIPHATALANRFECPLVYIRDKPKDHGLRNRIEGLDGESDLRGYHVIVIEDLISTGSSSAKAVQAVRDAGGYCSYCLSIFNYGLEEAVQEFGSLKPKCNVKSLLTYDLLLDVARETGYLNDGQFRLLELWRADPYGWGEKYGFPRVEKIAGR